MIVCKFGGTSVAKYESAIKIREIVKLNSNRKIVVVSAIGKSEEHKVKITDMLFQLFVLLDKKEDDYKVLIDEIFKRYEELSYKLQVKVNWQKEKKLLLESIHNNCYTKDYIVSRGEYYSAILYSKYLKMKFIDAKDCIIFNKSRTINYCKTKKRLQELMLKYKKFVVGGYYGADKNGKIITFDRGGSDITGAVIAKLLNAEIYENYTDVDGVFDKNPNIFEGAKQLPFLSFKTAIQMAENGNEIVHKSALAELKNSNTILLVKNTFNFNKQGTIITENDVVFKDIYICLNNVYVLKIDKLNEIVKQKINNLAQVKKIIKSNNGYLIIINAVYCNIQDFKQLTGFCYIEKVGVVNIFSNVQIDKKTRKNLVKLSKKIKNNVIFCNFLSYLNNFMIILKQQNANDWQKYLVDI